MGIKISALPSASTPLTGAELGAVVQGGVTKKVAISEYSKTDLLVAIDPVEVEIEPGFWVLGILLLPISDTSGQIGETSGGDELLASTAILAVDGLPFSFTHYSKTNTKSIFFSGFPTGSKVVFFVKRYLP